MNHRRPILTAVLVFIFVFLFYGIKGTIENKKKADLIYRSYLTKNEESRDSLIGIWESKKGKMAIDDRGIYVFNKDGTGIWRKYDNEDRLIWKEENDIICILQSHRGIAASTGKMIVNTFLSKYRYVIDGKTLTLVNSTSPALNYEFKRITYEDTSAEEKLSVVKTTNDSLIGKWAIDGGVLEFNVDGTVLFDKGDKKEEANWKEEDGVLSWAKDDESTIFDYAIEDDTLILTIRDNFASTPTASYERAKKDIGYEKDSPLIGKWECYEDTDKNDYYKDELRLYEDKTGETATYDKGSEQAIDLEYWFWESTEDALKITQGDVTYEYGYEIEEDALKLTIKSITLKRFG